MLLCSLTIAGTKTNLNRGDAGKAKGQATKPVADFKTEISFSTIARQR